MRICRRPTSPTVIAAEAAELAGREKLYRRDRAPLTLAGRTAIIVDDGLATGATARAAVGGGPAARRGRGGGRAPGRGRRTRVGRLRAEADGVVCPLVPAAFGAVSRYYDGFPQTSDDEVIACT